MMVMSYEVEAAGMEQSIIESAREPPEPPRIERCGAKPGGQLLLKCDEPAVIAVDIIGQPAPDVRWHVAGRRVRKSDRYRAAVSGRRHTLTVLRVTSELEKGVWVLASNCAGEDSCLITVKTYKVLSGLPNTFHDSVQNARLSAAMLNRTSIRRSTDTPFSPEARDQDVTSPTLTAWNKEMEIRNRMRSVDDLMYYGRWKRESLQANKVQTHSNDKVDRLDASLNQSFSCTSMAATDDEGRPGSSQRRRRSIRIRRRPNSRAGSIVSAPTARRVNLDESVGSGALDVDSMLRFYVSSKVTPVADDEIRRPAGKAADLPPSGLPPSGAAGRTTSARRTSLRRRRKRTSSTTDVMNVSTDTASSSFDDVQMTSSTVDLKDATAAVVAAAGVPRSSSMDRLRPVRRSLRRRRRTSQSPSRADTQDSTNAVATVVSTPPAPVTDVVKPEALWELCGEKLNELCQRILGIGIADTNDVRNDTTFLDNVTEFAYTEVNDVQPPEDVTESSSCNEVSGSPVSEIRRVFDNDDLTADRLSPVSDVGPDQNQITSQSLCPEDRREDHRSSVIGIDHNDEVAANDVRPYDSTEAENGYVPPLNEQFQTEACLPEHSHDGRKEPKESTVSHQLTVVCKTLTINENHVADVVDVPDQQNDNYSAPNVAHERHGLSGLDISAMLSPSIDLQDILDTIHTLTEGVRDENCATDAARSRLLSLENATSNDKNSCPRAQDDLEKFPDDVHLADQSASFCLDRADDDDDSSLDLDAEMYDYDLSPAAADLADSLHLAVIEDDDDLDIEDYEYDLDDDDVL